MSDPQRGSTPRDRLTRMADRMTEFLHADLEFREGDKCMIFLDDREQGGICMDGYNDDTEAIADLLMHLKALMKVNGKRMDLMFLDPEGVERFDG